MRTWINYGPGSRPVRVMGQRRVMRGMGTGRRRRAAPVARLQRNLHPNHFLLQRLYAKIDINVFFIEDLVLSIQVNTESSARVCEWDAVFL